MPSILYTNYPPYTIYIGYFDSIHNVVATPKLAKIPHTLIENHSFPLVERTPTMRSSTLVAVSRALAMPLKIASTIWWRFEP